jgi:2-dehydropantoate 2-reductase
VVSDAREVPAADAVIFAVKMRDTESAAEGLRGQVAKGAAVFTFQNGVESAERIGAVLGADKVVPGVARIGAVISEPGVIRQTGNFARIEFGERDGKPSARVSAFHQACVHAGVDATVSGSIEREVWMKFAMLAPLAGVTALTRGPIGPVRANPQSRSLLESAVGEVVAVGMSLKTGLAGDDVGKLMKVIDGLPKQMMASMAHDLLSGKPIELDGLSGAVSRLGRQQGVAVPTHTFIAQALAPFADGKPQV